MKVISFVRGTWLPMEKDMANGAIVCFREGQLVRLNAAGKAAQLTLKDRDSWGIGKIIPVPDNPVHPERYELDPPHPCGSISGMFLETAE